MPFGIFQNFDIILALKSVPLKDDEIFISKTPTVNRSILLLNSPKPIIEPPDEFFTHENMQWLIFTFCAILSTNYRNDFINVFSKKYKENIGNYWNIRIINFNF